MRADRIVSIQTTKERGGAEYANVDLLDALAERGHEVLLLTNVPELALGTRVTVRQIDLGPKLARRSAVRVALRSPRTLLRLAGALRAARPFGVVLVSFKKEQLLIPLLPKRLTGRVVWVEWGPVPKQMRRGPGRVAYALAARRAQRVLAVSAGTADTVIGAGVPREKVVVLPDLVNLHKVEPDAAGGAMLRSAWGVGEQTFVVGCVARFQRRKRNDVAIDAMTHIDGDVLLVMAGEGDDEQALRARAAPHGTRVRFVPNVRGHVDAFLSACDLLVFAPSPTEADRPRVIVMAQLVGLPIIATHPEGAGSLRLGETGTIISPYNDPLALALVLVAYRGDLERRRREGELARRTALEAYDPESTLQAVEEALELSD
ncbi:MAG TPA: glycosyltransferase family 4 protein [Solirubrobacteraceae bacterium]|nr:glycosyltransferase family 4 protein [Solirubrobacteraceae bacterium]